MLIKEAQDEAEEIALTQVVVPMESSPVVKGKLRKKKKKLYVFPDV